MYLVCFRLFSLSLIASHSLNYVVLENIRLIIEVMICASIRCFTITSITSDEFWATSPLFRFCFVKILSVASCFVAYLPIWYNQS